jgi:hypothetical protein
MTWTASWPVAKPAIINASPLIFLSRGGHLDLLRVFAGEVWVPEPVVGEIRERGAQDITATMIEKTDWPIIHPVAAIPSAISEWRLGRENRVFWLSTPRSHGPETVQEFHVVSYKEGDPRKLRRVYDPIEMVCINPAKT